MVWHSICQLALWGLRLAKEVCWCSTASAQLRVALARTFDKKLQINKLWLPLSPCPCPWNLKTLHMPVTCFRICETTSWSSRRLSPAKCKPAWQDSEVQQTQTGISSSLEMPNIKDICPTHVLSKMLINCECLQPVKAAHPRRKTVKKVMFLFMHALKRQKVCRIEIISTHCYQSLSCILSSINAISSPPSCEREI